MPMLGIAEILSDPDFQTNFTIVRTQQVVSDGGLGQPLQSNVNAYGVITPRGNETIQIEEGVRVQSVIEVFTSMGLTAGSGTSQADTVLYNGRYYRVMDVEDWSAWGTGFVKATCYETSYTDTPGVPAT